MRRSIWRALAVCVRWTYYGVFRLARGDDMLWVAGGREDPGVHVRACVCLALVSCPSASPRSRACEVHVMGAHYNVA